MTATVSTGGANMEEGSAKGAVGGWSVERQSEKQRRFNECMEGLKIKEKWKGIAERHIPKNRDRM